MYPLEAEGNSGVGQLLREWRRRRNMSQMELALKVGTSMRHLSFVETGRSQPSPAILEALISALAIPRHEAQMFHELSAFRGTVPTLPKLPLDKQSWEALSLLLSGQDPEAAVAFDQIGDILMVNRAYARFIGKQFRGEIGDIVPLSPIAGQRMNLLHLILAPDRYRRIITNWDEVARAVLHRLRRTLLVSAFSQDVYRLLQQLMKYPDVRRLWEEINPDYPPRLVVDIHMQLGERRVRTSSTIATLGGPSDLNLSGISIETFHRIAG